MNPLAWLNKGSIKIRLSLTLNRASGYSPYALVSEAHQVTALPYAHPLISPQAHSIDEHGQVDIGPAGRSCREQFHRSSTRNASSAGVGWHRPTATRTPPPRDRNIQLLAGICEGSPRRKLDLHSKAISIGLGQL